MVDVLVEYNYDAEQSDELTIKVGDTIKNVTMSEGGWWEGDLNGKRGMFPDNFVKVIPKKEEGKKKDVQASKRQSVKDLANKLKGQVHEGPPVIRKKESGFKKKKAKVVFSYDPENDDELKLEVGDMLDVLKQEEEGWWEGINNGKQGMFPSNFVEIVEESSETPAEAPDTKIENTEEHLIKGKKVQGIGLGNIFGDGPIKLRSTANKKPADRPTEPPKAESRSDLGQHKLKEMKKSLVISPHVASGDPVSDKAINRHYHIIENIDLVDTDLLYVDDDENCLINSSLNENDTLDDDVEALFEHGDVDTADNVQSDISKPNFAGISSIYSPDNYEEIDCNNNTVIRDSDNVNVDANNEVCNKVDYVNEAVDTLNDDSVDNWKAVLNDLDNCLDAIPDGNDDEELNDICVVDEDVNSGVTSQAVSSHYTREEDLPIETLETFKGSYDGIQGAECWRHTMLTPPEKMNFCKAIDSVLVTKHRLIESAEKSSSVEQTPVHGWHAPKYGQRENASRSLDYSKGDIGATGFVKFAQDIDENGCKVLVARPVESGKPTVSKTKKQHPVLNVKTEDTYLASQNKSGHLSPFIRSIANRYHLFDSTKPQFKDINVDELQVERNDDSYAMGLLGHHADYNPDAKDVEKSSADEETDLANPVVNQMVNNYVYDVITSVHSTSVDGMRQGTKGNIRQEDDESMAVCVDENSLRIVNSKEDLDDSSHDCGDISALLNMTGSTEQSPPFSSTTMFQVPQQWQSTPNKSENEASSPSTRKIMHKNVSVPCISTRNGTKRLPVAGMMRQRSSYCRIPFSSDAPSFWFCKDFAESPKCKSDGKTKIRSPKRSCSEISQDSSLVALTNGQTCMNGKITGKEMDDDYTAFLKACDEYSMSSKSPAKKKRKKITTDVPHTNLNTNALQQLPSEFDNSYVETFFPSNEDEGVVQFQNSNVEQETASIVPLSGRARNLQCKSASNIPSKKLPNEKCSVSFTSSYPELQDRHIVKKNIFGKSSKTSAKSPVRLLSYKQWNAESNQVGCQKGKKTMDSSKVESLSDIFQNFDAYTQSTLKCQKNRTPGSVLHDSFFQRENETFQRDDIAIEPSGDEDISGINTFFRCDNNEGDFEKALTEDDNEELADDSVLKVVGKKSVLHDIGELPQVPNEDSSKCLDSLEQRPNEIDESYVETIFPPNGDQGVVRFHKGSNGHETSPIVPLLYRAREFQCKSASNIPSKKLPSKKCSVSFTSSYPELQDRHKAKNIFGKSSKTSAKSPVKLLSYKQWNAESNQVGCQKGKKAVNSSKDKSLNNIFQNFDAYTQSTLKCQKQRTPRSVLLDSFFQRDNETFQRNDISFNSTDDNGIRITESFNFDNCQNELDDELDDNTVSAYFNIDDSLLCDVDPVEVSPIRVSRRFLHAASVGVSPRQRDNVTEGGNIVEIIKPFTGMSPEDEEKFKSQVEMAVKEHLDATNNVAQGSEDIVSMTKTRLKLYSAIYSAIDSYTSAPGEVDGETCTCNAETTDTYVDQEEHEDSIDNGAVTPDADGLVGDLNGLNLTDTPIYAHSNEEDNEMREFLEEAVHSLDNILVDSFNSYSESPNKDMSLNEKENPRDESYTNDGETIDGEELIDDSVLKVVGKRCIVHQVEEVPQLFNGESGEPQDSFEIHDPAFAVIGKKCVLHQAESGCDTISQIADEFGEDQLDDVASKIVDDVMNDISANLDDCSEFKTEQSALTDDVQKSNVVKKMDISVRECGTGSVEYDEAYDCDGNAIEERQPSYFCSSPLVPFYATEEDLITDVIESSFGTTDSPILYVDKDTFESPGYLDQGDGTLDRTRGSSIENEIEDITEDYEFVEKSEVSDVAMGEKECEYVGLEDIHDRMQDSGKWLINRGDQACCGDYEDEGKSGKTSEDAISQQPPSVFHEKVSTFPSPEIYVKKT